MRIRLKHTDWDTGETNRQSRRCFLNCLLSSGLPASFPMPTQLYGELRSHPHNLCQPAPLLTASKMAQFGLLPSLKTSLRRHQMPNMSGPRLGCTEELPSPCHFQLTSSHCYSWEHWFSHRKPQLETPTQLSSSYSAFEFSLSLPSPLPAS